MLIAAAAGLAVALAATVVLAGTTTPPPREPPRHARVDGSVLDREGAGVAGATVVVRPAVEGTDLALAFELITDAQGHFHLDGMPPGTYWFVAFGAGLTAGASPALPVIEHLEVLIRLEEQSTKA
jgi:hypothetical protein